MWCFTSVSRRRLGLQRKVSVFELGLEGFVRVVYFGFKRLNLESRVW